MEKKLRCLLFYYVASADRAKEDCEQDLKNWQDKEFYSDFMVGNVLPYEDVSPDLIEHLRSEHEAKRDSLAKELYSAFYLSYSQNSQKLSKLEYGLLLKKLGVIMAEELCEEMPWFNIVDCDWSLPTENYDDIGRWYQCR